MPARDPMEKLTEHINRLLDEREARAEARRDPRARSEKLMERLEAFLDAHEVEREAKAKKPRVVKEEGDDDDKTWSLFGG